MIFCLRALSGSFLEKKGIFIENLLDIAQSSAKIDKFADFVSMLHHRTGFVNENCNLGLMARKLICVL